MRQDPREGVILDALYRTVDTDAVERAEAALGSILRERRGWFVPLGWARLVVVGMFALGVTLGFLIGRYS